MDDPVRSERGARRLGKRGGFSAGASSGIAISDPLSPYTWMIWELLRDADPGTYSVQACATESTGALQTENPSRNLPDGADGFHRIRFVAQSPQTTDV
jgi:hypothetical protein